jgi:hypothetical protein
VSVESLATTPSTPSTPSTPARPWAVGLWSRRVTQLYVGLVLYGVSSAMQVQAGLGLDPWDVLHQGVANRVDRAIGTVVIAVGALVLLAWIPLRQRPGLGTVSNVVVLGLAMNATPGGVARAARLSRPDRDVAGRHRVVRYRHRYVHLSGARSRSARRADDRNCPAYWRIDPAHPHAHRGHRVGDGMVAGWLGRRGNGSVRRTDRALAQVFLKVFRIHKLVTDSNQVDMVDVEAYSGT